MPMAKVLLVDANQDSRTALSKALADAGYEVSIAPTGSSAVTTLEWERPDLVVSYAQVQDMDGYELLTLVRKDPTTMDTPFLLLAGRNRPVALAATEAGADMTVTGDFTMELVVGRVGDLLKPGPAGEETRPPRSQEAGDGRKAVEPLWAVLEGAGPKPSASPSSAGFQGSLGIMDLAEVTQAIALGGKTGCLVVSLAVGEGTLLFETGRVIHASFLGRTGEPAFAAILSASQREPDAGFRFSRVDHADVAREPRTISRSVEQLLLSIAVGIDEGEIGLAPGVDSRNPLSPAHDADR